MVIVLCAAVERRYALYDAALVPRIQRIKELQRTRFLPLKVIKELLDGGAGMTDDASLASAIGRVLEREGRTERRTRAEILAGGLPEEQLAWLEASGFVAALNVFRRHARPRWGRWRRLWRRLWRT